MEPPYGICHPKIRLQRVLGGKAQGDSEIRWVNVVGNGGQNKIQKSFLQAFEMGNYAKLPDPIYARNYLKVYVRALGATRATSWNNSRASAEPATSQKTRGSLARVPERSNFSSPAGW